MTEPDFVELETAEQKLGRLYRKVAPIEYPDEMSGKISEAIADSNGLNELIEKAERGVWDQIAELENQVQYQNQIG